MKSSTALALGSALFLGFAPPSRADDPPPVQVASVSLDWRDADGEPDRERGSVTVTVRASGAVDVVDVTPAKPYTLTSGSMSPALTRQVFAALNAVRVGELPRFVSAERDDPRQRVFEVVLNSYLQGDEVNTGHTTGLYYFLKPEHAGALQPALDAFALAEDAARQQLFESLRLQEEGRKLFVNADGAATLWITGAGGETREVRGTLTLAELRALSDRVKMSRLGEVGAIFEPGAPLRLSVVAEDPALVGTTTRPMGNAVMLLGQLDAVAERLVAKPSNSSSSTSTAGPPPGSTPGFAGALEDLDD